MRDIQPCIQHRPGNTGIIDTQRAGAYQPECTGSLSSVAANTIPCPPWLPIPWLPILNPSRIPPKAPHPRPPVHMYVESTIQKAHQPWDSTREVCAFLALPSVQHARARLPKARPFMRLPALDSQKAPGAFILPEPLEPLPSRPAQPTPPPTPIVITLLPASRARRARSHTFRFSS